MGVLTIDLGASSGRGIVFEYREGKLHQEEVHRFLNEPVCLGGAMYWDFLNLFAQVKTCIFKAAKKVKIDSVGIDTWGVDYAFLEKNGRLYSNPRHYRDARTRSSCNEFPFSPYEIFQKSGIAQNNFNTIYQIYEESKECELKGKTLLFMPQLFGYFLTGQKACENTIASTSALFNENMEIDEELRRAARAEELLFPPQKSGILGYLTEEVMRETQITYRVPLVLCPGHDTACAANVLPQGAELFLSSGTWSLLGALEKSPNLTREAFLGGFSNERGWKAFTLVKNITGMWLEQECKRAFEKEGRSYSFAELENLAASSLEGGLISVTDPFFAAPNGMPQRINEALAATGQKRVKSDGGIMKTVYRSLAMEYADSMQSLIKATGKKYDALYLLGGGSKNAYLNALTASSLKIPVLAGAGEATAVGNALAQMEITGLLSSSEIETIRGRAFREFLPRENSERDLARYREIKQIKLPV